MFRYENVSRSAGNKKWVSPTAVADYGDAQALWIPPRLPFPLGIAVGAAALTNRSGAAADCGLAVRLPVGIWEAGQVTSAGAYTADTADAQDADSDDFPLHNRADSGSGFLVGCDVPFNILGIVQSAAGDQIGPTKIVEYWDGAAWVDIVASLLINDGLVAAGTGEKVLCWPLPSTWVAGGSGAGVPGRYNVRVRHTTGGAGTVDPAASQVFVGVAKMLTPGLADKSTASLIRDHEYLFPRQGEALFPVFSVAHRGNLVEVDVRPY